MPANGSIRRTDVNLTGGRYGHALICACIRRNIKAIELLLDHGADITYTHDVYGNALHAACMAGNRFIAQLLLRRGISADERGGIYDHAIFAALFHPRGATLEALGPVADHVKQPNMLHSDFGTPLTAAVLACDRHSVRTLLARGADANLQGGTYGTALQAAAAYATKAMVSLLLKHGAKVNTLGGRYGTALQAASAREWNHLRVEPWSSDNKEITDGAVSMSSTEVSDDDVCPVDSSSTYRNSNTVRGTQRNEPKSVDVNVLAIVRFLLEHGADVNAKGGDYGTALHAAIHLQHEDVAKVLFAHGARPDEHILSCFDERSEIQCRNRFVGGELRPVEDSREGERDPYAYRPSNWDDRINWREHRFINLEEDTSDKEKGEFRCGNGKMQRAKEQERRLFQRDLEGRIDVVIEITFAPGCDAADDGLLDLEVLVASDEDLFIETLRSSQVSRASPASSAEQTCHSFTGLTVNECSFLLVPVFDPVTLILRDAHYYLAVPTLKAPAICLIDSATVNPHEADSFIKRNADDLINPILGKVLYLIKVDPEAVAKDSLFLTIVVNSSKGYFASFSRPSNVFPAATSPTILEAAAKPADTVMKGVAMADMNPSMGPNTAKVSFMDELGSGLKQNVDTIVGGIGAPDAAESNLTSRTSVDGKHWDREFGAVLILFEGIAVDVRALITSELRSIPRPPLPGMNSLVVQTIKVAKSLSIAARSVSATSTATAMVTKAYSGTSLDCATAGQRERVSTRDPKERPTPAIAAKMAT
ncbi:MAG: hypothetical protein Q9164_004109 [Protoblastenia rupestris]